MRIISTLLLLLVATATANAQVFTMRFRQPRVRTFCPSGQCPTPTVQVAVNSTIPVVAPKRFVLKTTQWDNRRWTFPGTIHSHLPGPPHYVPQDVLSGLTYNQKVILHNQLHNSGILQFSVMYPEYQATTISSQDCPDGTCPTGVTQSDCPDGSCPTTTVPTTVGSSSCPGGVCPAPTTRYRRGILGRRIRIR